MVGVEDGTEESPLPTQAQGERVESPLAEATTDNNPPNQDSEKQAVAEEEIICTSNDDTKNELPKDDDGKKQQDEAELIKLTSSETNDDTIDQKEAAVATSEKDTASNDGEDDQEVVGADEPKGLRSSGVENEPLEDEEAAEETKAFLSYDHYDPNNAPIHLVVNEWAQETSIHGVAEIADGYKWLLWKRMVWLALVITSGALMVWQIDSLVTEYQGYEVVTDTETLVPDSLEFPEITMCNMNRFSEFWMSLTGIEEPATPEEFRLISNTDLESFVMFGFYNDQELNLTDPALFKPVITSFGLCWSFLTSETIRRPGIFGGLELYFYLDQADYSEDTELAGVMFFAQEPGTVITDQLPFFTATPGRNAVVRLSKTEFVRERQAPWARCKSQAPQYTQPKCRDECLNAVLRNTCNCTSYNDVLAPPNMTYCQHDTNEDHSACLDGLAANESKILAGCDCALPPCRQTQYDAVVTNIDFSQKVLAYFEKEVGNGDPNSTADDFEHNFVGIVINYDKIQSNRLTETKAVTFSQLLGSIGGSMGLFLGISALTIFEVFGDFLSCRLLPRVFCGHRHLYGLGARPATSTRSPPST